MKTQQDHRVRIVTLENLNAMCARVSGWSHTFNVSKVSRSRVHVEYSNPDEYGNAQPITAVFPCYPSIWGKEDEENPRIVLDPLRIFGPDASWDMFYPLESCPTLWRNTVDERETWESHSDILRRQNRSQEACNGACVVCDIKGKE